MNKFLTFFSNFLCSDDESGASSLEDDTFEVKRSNRRLAIDQDDDVRNDVYVSDGSLSYSDSD